MSWQHAIAKEWADRRAREGSSEALFPLAANPFGEEEILAMTDVLLSGRLTLGVNVEKAEEEFAAAVGAPYAVMVNSGSSANLLMVSAVVNPQRPVHCKPGDEVLVPSVCWSTSVAPLLQMGLVPVFVDANPSTFNIDVNELENVVASHPKARALMAVHVLGNSTDMRALVAAVERHGLILMEDTCESLGSTALSDDKVGIAGAAQAVAAMDGPAGSQVLGTFGDFGSFSFYFSHHITSGEGGMVVCKTEADYNFLRCLRAHGWTRHLTNRFEVEASYPSIDSRFLFINVGYNLRPLEVQGAMLRVQIKKLTEFNRTRRRNLARIDAALSRNPNFSKCMAIMKAAPGTDPAWFGIGVVLHRAYAHQLRSYLEYLSANGVENRPIISGNFVRQPLIASYLPDISPEDFPGAEALHTRGFFIGVHQTEVEQDKIEKLVEVMLGFPFNQRRVVLVTGANGILGRHVYEEVSRAATEAPFISHCKDGNARHLLTRGTGIGPTGGKELFQVDDSSSEWIFVTRNEGDLTKMEDVENIFKKYQPSHVLHLAASLQSLNEMTRSPVDFWLKNVQVNNNVLGAAHKFQTWAGPMRVVSVLSTVMFPKEATYPVDAKQAVEGGLHSAGESYSLAKLSLAKLSMWYRQQHGTSFSTVLPGNFFGAYGDFTPGTAPLVNALIAKAEDIRTSSNPLAPLKVMGTGIPERQIMHASDLAKIMLWSIDHLDQELPLIVAGKEISITELAGLVCEASGITGGLEFDTSCVDGPLKRTADTSEFEKICPDFEYSSLIDGIRETITWYRTELVGLKPDTAF